MGGWLLFSTLALLIGVPSCIAGWLAGGFSDLRWQATTRRFTPPASVNQIPPTPSATQRGTQASLD